MDENLLALFASLSLRQFSEVASVILGTAVEVTERPRPSEILTPHNDKRTIGIVRVAGVTSAGETWASVAKLVDLSAVVARESAWVTPENEETVYEAAHFAHDGLPFRPARCYGTSRLDGNRKLIWLEDLTGAVQPPFDLRQLAVMARHVGQWNGRHHREPPHLGFPLPRDSFMRRWPSVHFGERLDDVRALAADGRLTRFTAVPLDTIEALYVAIPTLHARSITVPHALAFGDLAVGNLFSSGEETIAVDWASLSFDPLGVDAGCMVGSATTWGRNFTVVAMQERDLFDAYVEGLRSAGWHGAVADVRRGYLCQYAFYAFTRALFPAVYTNPGKYFSIAFIEGRYQMSIDEVATASREASSDLPRLLAEIVALAA